MLNILRALAHSIAEALSNGDSVRLARIEILSAGLTSEGGADTLEELRHLPKDTTVNFRAASELRTALANAGDTFTGDVTDCNRADGGFPPT